MTAIRPLVLAAGLLAAFSLSLAGCGNKGSLVRPPVVAEEAPPADELPPPTEPTEADQPAEIDPPAASDPPSDPATEPVSGDIDG